MQLTSSDHACSKSDLMSALATRKAALLAALSATSIIIT
jgi:hypothetical protein